MTRSFVLTIATVLSSVLIAQAQQPAPAIPAAPRAPAIVAQAAPPVPPAPPAPPSDVLVMPGLGRGSYLGIGVQEVDAARAKELKLSEERGVEVTTVADDSPASKAGLQENDVVLEYNGQRVEGVEQFVRMVRETPAGRNVKLLVSRGGSTRSLTATVRDRKQALHFNAKEMQRMGEDIGREFGPDSKFQEDMKKMQEELGNMHFDMQVPDLPQGDMAWKSGMLGVEAESLNPQLAEFFGVKQGVLVRSVMKDTPADRAGFKAGDVITKISDNDVSRPSDISRQLRAAGPGKTVPISITRNKQQLSLNVTVEARRPSTAIRPRRIRTSPAPFVRGRMVSFPSPVF